MTIDDLVDEYLTFNVLSKASEECYRDTASLCRKLLSESNFNDIAKIRSDDLIRLRREILKKQKPISFNSHRNRLRTLFRFAVRQGFLDENPTDKVLLVPTHTKMHKTLSQDSIDKILIHLELGRTDESRFWLAVTYTLYWTGMRRRQLAGLRWSDIDWGNMSIRMAAENSKTRKEWIIPMAPELKEVLWQFKAWADKKRGYRQEPSGQVFDMRLYTRQAMNPKAITHFYWALGNKLGIKVSPHRFRHTVATELANTVPNIKIVQEILGHADVQTTCRYIHPDLAAMRTALSSLRGVMENHRYQP